MINKEVLFVLAKGTYSLNSATQIYLAEDIKFENGFSYIIEGENGSGKSSFVRNVVFNLINKECKGKIQYLYFDQEILAQFYYGKAYLLIKEHKGIKKIEDLILAIAKLHIKENIYKNNKFILILDEIDKYISIVKVIELFSDFNITLINVTHKVVQEVVFDMQIMIKKIDEFNSIVDS